MIKTIYMFPGQGAQIAGMGRELFPRFPEQVEAANDILGYDVRALCAGECGDDLHHTRYTQPALFMSNALHYLAAIAEQGKPQAVLGHSLGEYNALFAAGVFDFATGMRLVKYRAEAMAAQTLGGMAAVLKLDLATVETLLREHPAGGVIDIANINSRQQFVLAGTKAALEALAPALQEVGAIVMALKVSGAFHSRYMRPAAQSLAEVLDKTPLARQQIPVISNVTAKPHQDGHIVDRLVEQLYSPVRWLQSVEYLLRDGECEFHEIGVGQTLTGLLRYIQKGM